jgi:hypothetical protein
LLWIVRFHCSIVHYCCRFALYKLCMVLKHLRGHLLSNKRESFSNTCRFQIYGDYIFRSYKSWRFQIWDALNLEFGVCVFFFSRFECL